MRYVSTRGDAPVLDFSGTLLTGLASDGGLYVPETFPPFDADELRSWAGRPYAEVATAVLAPLVAPAIGIDELGEIVADAYATFDHPDVVPLRPLGDDEWLLELFHGPTLSFKDVALQVVGRLFERELRRTGKRLTIVGATSGDTGSAAIDAVADREGIELVMLHPHGRVSEVQRRQMTTVTAPNIHNVAIDGTFDDCQDLVKAMFADPALRDELSLGAVNSINWARVAVQSVYYVTSLLALDGLERPVEFTVPTGNFGNIYAGHVSRRRGLPIAGLTIASNRNDVLTRFVRDGAMRIAEVEPSLSPAMDIQVSSNFERVLYEAVDADGPVLGEIMREFRSTGLLPVDDSVVRRIREGFGADTVSDDETLATIATVAADHGVVIDPHTAVGVTVARRRRRPEGTASVILACAHPAKFADTVERATGAPPIAPPSVLALADREERYEHLSGDLDELVGLVRSAVAR